MNPEVLFELKTEIFEGLCALGLRPVPEFPKREHVQVMFSVMRANPWYVYVIGRGPGR